MHSCSCRCQRGESPLSTPCSRLTCAVLPMMISGASPSSPVPAAAPATPVTAASRTRESPPLLGVLLELVGGPRRRTLTCTAGVGEGSAARIASSSRRISAKVGLRVGSGKEEPQQQQQQQQCKQQQWRLGCEPHQHMHMAACKVSLLPLARHASCTNIAQDKATHGPEGSAVTHTLQPAPATHRRSQSECQHASASAW